MSSAKALAQQHLQAIAIEIAKAEAHECPPTFHEILAADRAADGEKGFCQRRCDTRQFGS
jgi:hypothetical protein